MKGREKKELFQKLRAIGKMRSKKFLITSLIVLSLSIVASAFVQSVFATITELKIVHVVGNQYRITGKSAHPNAVVKVYYMDGKGPEIDISGHITQGKNTDGNGDFETTIVYNFPPGWFTIYVEIQGNKHAIGTYAMGIPVGGHSLPVRVDKSGLLGPYISVISGILATAVAAPIYIRHRIQRKDQ